MPEPTVAATGPAAPPNTATFSFLLPPPALLSQPQPQPQLLHATNTGEPETPEALRAREAAAALAGGLTPALLRMRLLHDARDALVC